MTEKIEEQKRRLAQMLRDDPRYPWPAYLFVREALFYAQEVLEMGAAPDEELARIEFAAPHDREERPGRGGRERPERHLTGQQLCQAIRSYALEQYGYMAKVVLNQWGIRATGDIGEIVYNLIRVEEMRKSPTDRREDFDDVFDFEEAFRRGFQFTRA